jgi:hypothetical protein
MWHAGLMEYDELKGIAWKWQAADGVMTKAPLGGQKTGPNPTDRAKRGTKCVIRPMPIADSDACRSLIPAYADHRFRPCRSPETLA